MAGALAPEVQGRGRITRRVRQAGVYFVTTATWYRRQLFLKPEPARIVLEQILDCRGRGFYKLHAFVIMPEHLHILLTPSLETSLEKAMQLIKGGSSHRIRKELLYSFPVWHQGFHDRWIRNPEEYLAKKKYIESNPVAARLAEGAQEYPYCSAGGQFEVDRSEFD